MMVIDNKPRDETEGTVLSRDVQEQLLTYEGKWVAMTQTEILAVGDSPDEVLHSAAEQGANRPILYRVPRDGKSSLFL